MTAVSGAAHIDKTRSPDRLKRRCWHCGLDVLEGGELVEQLGASTIWPGPIAHILMAEPE